MAIDRQGVELLKSEGRIVNARQVKDSLNPLYGLAGDYLVETSTVKWASGTNEAVIEEGRKMQVKSIGVMEDRGFRLVWYENGQSMGTQYLSPVEIRIRQEKQDEKVTVTTLIWKDQEKGLIRLWRIGPIRKGGEK